MKPWQVHISKGNITGVLKNKVWGATNGKSFRQYWFKRIPVGYQVDWDTYQTALKGVSWLHQVLVITQISSSYEVGNWIINWKQ